MQEWVDTLRLKLREMKILSPKENLYSKLPELRPPLLPTRDPNSPLPATPPVPAAIVPGVIVNTTQTSRIGVTYSSVVTAANIISNNNNLGSVSSQTQPSSSLATTSNSTTQSDLSHLAIDASESQQQQQQQQQIQHSRKHPSTSASIQHTSSDTGIFITECKLDFII